MSKERLVQRAVSGFSLAGLLALTGCADTKPNNAIPTSHVASQTSETFANSVAQNVNSTLELPAPSVSGFDNSHVEIIRLGHSRFLVASWSPEGWGINSSGSLVYIGVKYMRNHGCDELFVNPVDLGTVQVTTGTPETCLPDLK